MSDICGKCERDLDNEYTEFFDKNFHPKCFNCEQCGINLMRKPFKAIGKVPYCNKCVENTPKLYQQFKKQKFDNSGRVYAKKGKPPKKVKSSSHAPAGATSGTNTVVTTTTATSKQTTHKPPPKQQEQKPEQKQQKDDEQESTDNKKVTKTTFVFCCTIS